MKRMSVFVLLLVFTVLQTSSGYGEDIYKNTMKAAFPNPEKPGLLKIVSGNGNVTVTGYAGKEVIIEAQSKSKKALREQENEKAKGLKRIAGSGLNVITKQDENAVVIERSMYDTTDLDIKVPFQTALKIGEESGIIRAFGLSDNEAAATGLSRISVSGGSLQGGISVAAVTGSMEVRTLKGTITIQNISGNVVSNSMNGDITCTIKSLDKEKPSAFSTLHRDIDLTLPPDVHATLVIKNVDGNVYSDFDMDITKNTRNTGLSESAGGSDQRIRDLQSQLNGLKVHSIQSKSMRISKRDSSTVTFNIPEPPEPPTMPGMYRNNITGKINGGGVEIQLSTLNGNVYIRKGK